uniref:Uncharacterized protein n=1 Tax=Rhizophora mucronata TaxID=61149 RepID=A0A2P2NGH8_RHIMU
MALGKFSGAQKNNMLAELFVLVIGALDFKRKRDSCCWMYFMFNSNQETGMSWHVVFSILSISVGLEPSCQVHVGT